MTLLAQQAGFKHHLRDFLNNTHPRNKWIYTSGYRIYVQVDINRKRFWLKAIEVNDTGKGTFRNVILPVLGATLFEAEYRELIIENVQQDRFANFFRKLGWSETTDGATYTFTSQLREPIERHDMDADYRAGVLEALGEAAKIDGKIPSLKVLDALRWKIRRFLVEVPQDVTTKELLDALEDPITAKEYHGEKR